MRWLSVVFVFLVGAPCVAVAESPALLINEILASNYSINKDPQGHYDDWIELHNPGATSVDTGGLYLTDDPAEPTKWQIPMGRPTLTVIPPKGYLLLWADNDPTASGLHAGFEFSTSGEQVALFDSDGETLIDYIKFDEQRPDVSYGRDSIQSAEWRYLALPTPGTRNAGAYLGKVADTKFSHDRGFYTEPFAVTITTKTPDASIYYTTDGSSPLDLKQGLATGILYSGPVPISTTTSLRAVACKLGWLATDVDTQTYIFLDDVVNQATNPATGAQVTPPGCPEKWEPDPRDRNYSNWATNDHSGDYQMDPDIVGPNGKDKFGGLYANTIREDLKAVPTISLVMALDDWFGPNGIYVHKSQDGTERAASMEYIDPATGETFQVNCAIAVQGGVPGGGGGTSLSRWKTYKLSMRPRFKTHTDDGTPTGGPSQFEFPLFPDSPVTRFNTIVLDAVTNHSWLHSGQHQDVMYVQDQYVADLHNTLGGHSPHGAYAHLYINGLYWGMYYIHERPDHAWAAETFGGDEDEYDAIKHNAGGVINSGVGGDATANYNAMVRAAQAVSADPDNMAKYQALCNLLDVDEFITYILTNWYTGNHDWPHKNWYATHRNTPDGKWRFHSWDAEHTTEIDINSIGQSPGLPGMSPNQGIHTMLANNAEYRMRFADIIHRSFFHEGPLSYPVAADLYKARMNQIDRAIVGESARWGDNRRSSPHTRLEWFNTQITKLTDFFPSRSNQVLNSLKSANLYPAVAAPEFRVSGVAQHGGHTAAGASLSMTASAGDIWYTLDGTDPRVPGAAPKPSESVTLVAESALKLVLVPTGPIDDAWKIDPAFAVTGWLIGGGGVGFERQTGYENYFDIDVESSMYQKNATCYIRMPFTATAGAMEGLTTLTLKVRYDDGFIAYLNGSELQRANFGGTPAWNSAASASHSDLDAINLQSFDVSSHIADLRVGWNVLALHGLNESTSSSDFLISVELIGSNGPTGDATTPGGVSPTARRYAGPIALSNSVLVRSRTLANGVWSALNEAIFAVGPVAESLRISEIMYHPAEDPNAEYIELTNAGSETINLNRVRFSKGIEYSFPSFELPPGGYCLVVKDIAAFEAAYGNTLAVLGPYAGSLNNGGEQIELLDAAGGIIQSFEYKDDWFPLTDGLGFSLTIRDAQAAVDPGDEAAWRPSTQPGGSPGTDDI